MDGYDGSVMVALLPVSADWSKLELPHLTLVYAGETDELSPSAFNELAKDASSISMLSKPLSLRVLGVETFGGGFDPQVEALRFRSTPELDSMRNFLERWNASVHPFNPHATIGPVGTVVDVPAYVAFDRITVGWGKEYLTFWLRG